MIMLVHSEDRLSEAISGECIPKNHEGKLARWKGHSRMRWKWASVSDVKIKVSENVLKAGEATNQQGYFFKCSEYEKSSNNSAQ